MSLRYSPETIERIYCKIRELLAQKKIQLSSQNEDQTYAEGQPPKILSSFIMQRFRENPEKHLPDPLKRLLSTPQSETLDYQTVVQPFMYKTFKRGDSFSFTEPYLKAIVDFANHHTENDFREELVRREKEDRTSKTSANGQEKHQKNVSNEKPQSQNNSSDNLSSILKFLNNSQHRILFIALIAAIFLLSASAFFLSIRVNTTTITNTCGSAIMTGDGNGNTLSVTGVPDENCDFE